MYERKKRRCRRAAPAGNGKRRSTYSASPRAGMKPRVNVIYSHEAPGNRKGGRQGGGSIREGENISQVFRSSCPPWSPLLPREAFAVSGPLSTLGWKIRDHFASHRAGVGRIPIPPSHSPLILRPLPLPPVSVSQNHLEEKPRGWGAKKKIYYLDSLEVERSKLAKA